MPDDARAAEINPYASPIAVGKPPSPGVGVWREGPLLVLHKDSELPRLCIFTGEPAAGGRDFCAFWRHPGDLTSRATHVLLPLRHDHLQAYARARLHSLIGLLLAAIGLIVLFSMPALSRLGDWVVPCVLFPSLAAGAVGVGMWWLSYRLVREPIKLVFASGDYLWFAGIHPAVLAHLPPWQPQ